MPQEVAGTAWLKYTEGKRPLIYVESYSQYVQCAFLYLEGAATVQQRAELLPLIRLRHHASDGSKRHALVRKPSWMVHAAEPIARLSNHATFFPLTRTLYLLQRNNHSVGKLAQYMMMKLKWRVFAFRTEVPQQVALEAERLAVPMHSWFKRGP